MTSALVRTGGILLGGAALLGVVEAWLWSRIAPGVDYQVFDNQSWAPLPTSTQHLFVAFAMFALIGVVTGFVLAAVGWAFRPVRGFAMLLLVTAGAGLCALIAGLLGQLWADGMDPASVAMPGVQTVVSAPAVINGWPAYLAAPTAAVVAFTVMAAWNGMPDLGREPQPA